MNARVGLTTAADLFVGLVARARSEQWDAPGLGEWTVRDLVGHTSLALLTLEEHLDCHGREVEVPGPAAYFRALLARTTPEENTQAGRDAGKQLGPSPATEIAALAQRVLPKVHKVSDSLVIQTSVGGMRLVDYLPTRVFELTVHSFDLAGALGVQIEPSRPALVTSLQVLGNLASATPEAGVSLLMAGTGRLRLPEGFTLV